MDQIQIRDFIKLGEGNQHIVYQYIGNDQQLQNKVIRIAKSREWCKLSLQLIPYYNQTDWTPLKKYFCQRSPFQWDGIKCEIMDNLFYNVEFAIEIKPKTFLPILTNKQIDKDYKNIKNTRFYMMQLLKAKQKNTKPSQYNPNLFFSSRSEDIKKAIKQMQEIPENNYRLFKNGKKVQQLDNLDNDDIATIISESIVKLDIIPILRQFFLMIEHMNVTVEEVISAYEYLSNNITEEQIQQIKSNSIQDFNIQSKIFTLMTFSCFQALSDLSIIGSFKCEETKQNIIHKEKKYSYQYHIVDCDLKRFGKIFDYQKTIDELLNLQQEQLIQQQ